MELKDYTIEELEAEIKRRKKEARAAYVRPPREYAYITATVVDMFGKGNIMNWDYRLQIDEECKSQVTENFLFHARYRDFKLISGAFNKKTAPQIGDRVRLKSAKTKTDPTGFGSFSDPKICEKLEV